MWVFEPFFYAQWLQKKILKKRCRIKKTSLGRCKRQALDYRKQKVVYKTWFVIGVMNHAIISCYMISFTNKSIVFTANLTTITFPGHTCSWCIKAIVINTWKANCSMVCFLCQKYVCVTIAHTCHTLTFHTHTHTKRKTKLKTENLLVSIIKIAGAFLFSQTEMIFHSFWNSSTANTFTLKKLTSFMVSPI